MVAAIRSPSCTKARWVLTTVTLSTEQPGALNTWLESHGYNVDDSSQPIIDQYVTEGFDFIALRLQPGKGVSQMTPVRVVVEGGNLTLPLRMVGIGTGAQTPIVLYVVGEGRYGTSSFGEVQLDTSLLSWNFKTQESNYTTLHDDALALNGGLSYLTTFAQGGFFANSNLFNQDTQQSTRLRSAVRQPGLEERRDGDRLHLAPAVRPQRKGQEPLPARRAVGLAAGGRGRSGRNRRASARVHRGDGYSRSRSRG